MENHLRVSRYQKLHDPYFDTYVCLDIETTSRPLNRIIEIAAVKVVKGRVVKEFKRLVDPGVNIPLEITRLTKITNNMVRGRHKIWQVLPELKAFVGDYIIVGHDVINNDMKNLISVSQNTGVVFDNPLFDTFNFSKTFMPGTCGLSKLCEILMVPWEERHRALSDARANQEVFEKMKIIYFMMQEEGINLNEKEMAKIAQNPENYMGITDKFSG